MFSDGALALALGAGVVAAVNPCGFALLPAYLSLFVLDEHQSRTTAVLRALKATAAMTAGFAGVFAIFGLAVAPVASSVQEYLPSFTVVLGVLLALAGLWVLAGRHLPTLRLGRPSRSRSAVTGSLGSMTAFGASYAVASLGCTIAPFLAVVVSSFRAGSTLQGVVLFLVYALGMGLVVGTAAVAVALARTGPITRLRRTGAILPRLGGALLLIGGGYVAWYGAWELRVLHGNAGQDGVVNRAASIQHWLSELVSGVGPGDFLIVLVLLLAAAWWLSRRTPPSTSTDDRGGVSEGAES